MLRVGKVGADDAPARTAFDDNIAGGVMYVANNGEWQDEVERSGKVERRVWDVAFSKRLDPRANLD